MGLYSCKKNNNHTTTTWSPDPVNGELPTSVLPEELKEAVGEYFVIYDGNNPAKVHGEFISQPHVLIANSIMPNYNYQDTTQTMFYNDRYICFDINSNGYIDFYGKQWDDSLIYSQGEYHGGFYEETYRNLKSTGTGDKFTCYYITEGYPNGMYAKFSTIFSGKWNSAYGGIKDFQVAVILLETSGNPELDPVNSYRILGDYDGLAKNDAWMKKGAMPDRSGKLAEDDAFFMFRKR